MYRVLCSSGIAFSSVFSIEDTYYQQFAHEVVSDSLVVVDPHNGIPKYLYTEQEFREFFASRFNTIHFTKFEFEDVVLEKRFRRSILTLIMGK